MTDVHVVVPDWPTVETLAHRVKVLVERLDIVWDALMVIQLRIGDIKARLEDDGK